MKWLQLKQRERDSDRERERQRETHSLPSPPPTHTHLIVTVSNDIQVRHPWLDHDHVCTLFNVPTLNGQSTQARASCNRRSHPITARQCTSRPRALQLPLNLAASSFLVPASRAPLLPAYSLICTLTLCMRVCVCMCARVRVCVSPPLSLLTSLS